MSSKPKVSVLIPTYNRSLLLKKALSSVLAQSYIDLEVIIVDNCSSDDTELCINSFTDKRIRYYKNDINIGPINNYNKALCLAEGEYIYLFSDDDIMLSDNILLKVNVLDEFSNVGIVHSNINIIDENDNITKGHWASNQKEWDIITNKNIISGKDVYDMLYDGWNFISMPSVLIRKSILHQKNIQFSNQLKYLIDWDLWLKMSLFCDIYFLNEVLVLYREHSSNETIMLNPDIYFVELVIMKISAESIYGNGLNRLSICGISECTKIQVANRFGISPDKKSILIKNDNYIIYFLKKCVKSIINYQQK